MTLQVFFCCYLVAWLFVWGMAQGSLALVMIHHLTGGAWGVVLRRILEAQMRTLPLVGLLFLPVGLGASHIYPWAGSTGHTENRFFSAYFQPQFVWGRGVPVPGRLEQRHRAVPLGRAAHRSAVGPVPGDPHGRSGALDGDR